MKQLSSWLLIAASGLATLAAHAEDRVVTFSVQDPGCSNCTSMVKRVLGRIDGVKNVTVKPDKHEAVVTFDDSRTDAESLIDVSALAGYPATVKR